MLFHQAQLMACSALAGRYARREAQRDHRRVGGSRTLRCRHAPARQIRQGPRQARGDPDHSPRCHRPHRLPRHVGEASSPTPSASARPACCTTSPPRRSSSPRSSPSGTRSTRTRRPNAASPCSKDWSPSSATTRTCPVSCSCTPSSPSRPAIRGTPRTTCSSSATPASARCWPRTSTPARRRAPCPRPSTPTVTAGLLIAAADGLQTQWLLDPEVDMAAHLSSLVSLLCPAPAPAPASAQAPAR